MADVYTRRSCTLRCTPEEAERFVAAFGVTADDETLPACLQDIFAPTSESPDDPLYGIAAIYDDGDLTEVGRRSRPPAAASTFMVTSRPRQASSPR